MKLKLVSWNVNGIRASGPKGLLDFVQVESPDILCLQETKAHIEQVEEPLKTLGYAWHSWSSAVKKGYSGVATFSKRAPISASKGIDISRYDSEGRFVITQFPEFELFNIYFPNGGSGDVRHQFKQEFLKELLDLLKTKIAKGEKIIVVGDYNVAHREVDIYDPKRLSKESGFLPEERAWFDDFLKAGFVDTYRTLHPEVKEKYSWWSYREFARVNNRGWRIDYICTTENLRSNLKSADVMDHIIGSDHCPVIAEFEF